jgi:hypothetical protein
MTLEIVWLSRGLICINKPTLSLFERPARRARSANHFRLFALVRVLKTWTDQHRSFDTD